jgi:hypothetical protein
MGSSIIGNNNTVSGRNIIIQNGAVMVDGKRVELPENERIINIRAENLESIHADSCNELSVKGNAGDIHVSHGRVSIGGDVKGDVRVSQGNVDCGNVEGDVSVSMGNISSRRG